jgi:hypothetical protein
MLELACPQFTLFTNEMSGTSDGFPIKLLTNSPCSFLNLSL